LQSKSKSSTSKEQLAKRTWANVPHCLCLLDVAVVAVAAVGVAAVGVAAAAVGVAAAGPGLFVGSWLAGWQHYAGSPEHKTPKTNNGKNKMQQDERSAGKIK